MEFAVTDEQRAICALARRFGEDVVRPNIAEWDRAEYMPRDLYKRLAELGFLGGSLPEKYGGSELDYVTLAMLIEELSYFSPKVGGSAGHPSCSLGMGLLMYGTEEQRERFLRPTLTGDIIGATALTEPHSGSDVVRHITTTVERDGDDYVINGQKAWVSNASHADWFITFATIDKSKGHKGVCAFLVERGFAGVTTTQYKNNVGFRTSMTGDVFYDNVRVPRANLLGEEGLGYKVMMAGAEIGRLSCAARAVGAIRYCLDLAVAYAKERVVFEHPIGTYQLIQEKIAKMSVGLEASRMLTYRLAWMRDQGNTRLQKEASMAKLFATDTLMMAASETMQILGSAACSGESPIGRVFRDAKFMQIVDGANELQTKMIAEHELGYRG